MKYMTAKQYGIKLGVSRRRALAILDRYGVELGAQKLAGTGWIVPVNAGDPRQKKYMKN